VLDRKHLHDFPGSGGLLKKQAFFDLHSSLKFELPGQKPVNMARWWYGSDYRHVYDGIVLAPEGKRPDGKPAPANTFNLWRGFACEPSEQGSCEKSKEFMLKIVCNGDKDLRLALASGGPNRSTPLGQARRRSGPPRQAGHR
jgi:hypothetical protein